MYYIIINSSFTINVFCVRSMRMTHEKDLRKKLKSNRKHKRLELIASKKDEKKTLKTTDVPRIMMVINGCAISDTP